MTLIQKNFKSSLSNLPSHLHRFAVQVNANYLRFFIFGNINNFLLDAATTVFLNVAKSV